MGVKEAYQIKADSQLCEWQGWIEQYKTSDGAGDYQRLEQAYQTARSRLNDLSTSSDDRWEFSKQAVERAMIDLKRLLDESGAAQNARYLTLQTSRSYAYQPFYRRS